MEPCKTRNNLLAICATVQVASCVFFVGPTSTSFTIFFSLLSLMSNFPHRAESAERIGRSSQAQRRRPEGRRTWCSPAHHPHLPPPPPSKQQRVPARRRGGQVGGGGIGSDGGEGGEIHHPSLLPKRWRGRRDPLPLSSLEAEARATGQRRRDPLPPLLLPRSGGEGSKVATAVAGRRPRQRRRAGLHAGAAGERRERWRRRAEQQTMAPPSIPFLSSLPSLKARSESVVPQATRNP